MSDPDFRPKRIVVDIPEAKDKRIRELLIEEPYSDSHEFHVVLVFDDETEIVLELEAKLKFAVDYLQLIDGDLEPVKEYPPRLLRP